MLKFKRCDINVLEPGWEELEKLVGVQVNIRVIFVVHLGMIIVIHAGNIFSISVGVVDGHYWMMGRERMFRECQA